MPQPAEDVDNVRFNVLRNALYHTARRRFFEKTARWLDFLVVVLGTATAASVATPLPGGATALGAFVAVIGALQLTFNLAGQARDHQAFQRDYYRLLAKIDATPEPGAAEVAGWRSEMVLITADEPPTMRAIDAKAYNDALGAMEIYPPSERLLIPWCPRWFGQMLTFEGVAFRKLGEIT